MTSFEESVPWWEGLYHDPLPIGGIAVALMLGTYGLFQIPLSIPLLVAGGCGTALVYGVDRGILRSPEDEINHPERRQWMHANHRWLLGELSLFGGCGGVALIHLRAETLILIAGIGFVAGLHLIPVGKGRPPLKSLGMGKPLAIAASFAVGSTLLPVLEAGSPVDIRVLALAGYRILFILPNVLVADWADREGDRAVGLDTWTTEWTLHHLRVVLTLILGGGMASAAGAVALWGVSSLLLLDAVGLLATLGAVWGLRPSASSGHLFLLDAVVAWPIVVWLVATMGM